MTSSYESPPWRLLVDPPAAGTWNMALDEALLESAAAGGPPTLRFYQWNEPTLSLGYFQSHAERAVHPASGGCALVRRLSGGGAILHDRELTYSLALPARHPLASETATLYKTVHRSLIAALSELGVTARLCGDEAVERPAEAEPFLCFQRRSSGDVLAGSAKIAGSAQRRRQGAVLQHGSVLLAASPAAPELPGVAEVTGRALASQRLSEIWLKFVPQHLGAAVEPARLSPAEEARAGQLVEQKYAAAGWTLRR